MFNGQTGRPCWNSEPIQDRNLSLVYWSRGRGKEKGGGGGELTFTGILISCMYNITIITPTNMSNYLICMLLAVSVQSILCLAF